MSRVTSSVPTISVIVPTFNRAHWLGDAIRSLVGQRTPAGVTHEILIVDNDSSDETASVARELIAESKIPIQYHVQTKRGDAATRNLGVEKSQGSWLAFFDDDQLAEPNWLSGLYRAAGQANAQLVGGPVHLHLPEQRLEALGWECRHALREIRFYNRLQPYTGKDLPGTGNALVSRKVFDAIGTFDESMLTGGSDIDFFVRARARGFTLWYSPDAIIRHRVSEERLSPAYFRWDAVSGGADHAAYFDYQKRGKLGLIGMCLLRLGHALLWNLPRYLARRLLRGEQAALGRRLPLWRAEGYIRRTLSILAPGLCPQTAFFDSLDFRHGRTIEESVNESPQPTPTTTKPQINEPHEVEEALLP